MLSNNLLPVREKSAANIRTGVLEFGSLTPVGQEGLLPLAAIHIHTGNAQGLNRNKGSLKTPGGTYRGLEPHGVNHRAFNDH